MEIQKISSVDELSNEEVAMVMKYLWAIASIEWRQAFQDLVINPRAYVRVLARVSNVVRQKIEEYEGGGAPCIASIKERTPSNCTCLGFAIYTTM